jgi:hypothetical protein
MNTVKDMCDRAVWLDHGVVTGAGDPSDLVDAYTEQMLGEHRRASDGSIRRGSGEAQIVSVELFVGDQANPVKRCRTGDNVRVRLHYKTSKPVPRPVIGFEIEHLGGPVITSPSTRDVGLIPERLGQEGHIDIVLADIALLPGTYDLHTSITDFNRSHVYDHLQVALRFDVMSGRPYETAGVVTLRPTWHLDDVAPTI